MVPNSLDIQLVTAALKLPFQAGRLLRKDTRMFGVVMEQQLRYLVICPRERMELRLPTAWDVTFRTQ